MNEFINLFRIHGNDPNLINMYLVFLGIRSACLVNRIYEKKGLEIHYGIYPGYSKHKFDYPLVCLKNSWVSKLLPDRELSESEMGLFLGYECYDQDWKNVHINRYEISYILNDTKRNIQIFTEVCSKKPNVDFITRIKFKAKQINDAMRMININYKVRHKINFVRRMKI